MDLPRFKEQFFDKLVSFVPKMKGKHAYRHSPLQKSGLNRVFLKSKIKLMSTGFLVVRGMIHFEFCHNFRQASSWSIKRCCNVCFAQQEKKRD